MDVSLMISRAPEILAGIPITLGLVSLSLLFGGLKHQRQHFSRGRLGGNDRQATSPVHQHAQDVAFHPEIVGHHVVVQLAVTALRITLSKLPRTLPPVIGFTH